MRPFENWVYYPSESLAMIRVDGNFLYQLGAAVHPLTGLNAKWTKGQLFGLLFSAESWLDTLLNQSVFGLKTSWSSGTALLKTVRRVKDDYMAKENTNFEDNLIWTEYYSLSSEAKTFETVLSAELQLGQLYLVQPKGGYDLLQLTENGIVIFPPDLIEKVPEAIADANEAARCIGFALPTAAAFHLHRLHELVLRRYYDTVTGGKPRPINRNIGAYIDSMKNHQFKDPKIFSALANLKDFHRNPVLQPDDRLEDTQEAIALLGSVNTVIIYMLKALRPAPLELTSPPTDEPKALEAPKTTTTG